MWYIYKDIAGVNIRWNTSKLNIHPNIRYIWNWQSIKYLLWIFENNKRMLAKTQDLISCKLPDKTILINKMKLSKK